MDSGYPRKVIGMPNVDYHSANDHDGRSFIWSVYKGGGAAQQWMDQGHRLFEGNNATSLGSDFDSLVMGMCEGKAVDDVLVVAPADCLSSNGQRRGRAWEEFKAKADAEGKIPCSDELYFKLGTMADSLMACPPARKCVEETTETQVSLFFEHNGHRLKVRPDGCTPTCWWDLKSTSADWDSLYRSIITYGYHAQEWLYVRGAMSLGMDEFRMPFVFVRSAPPFDCRCFYLPAELVAEAGRIMERTLEEIRLRRSTGVYLPVEHGEITELPIPQWAMKQEEEVVL